LGGERSVVIQNFNGVPTEVITQGSRREQNLFHSFTQFNISEGRSAYFFVPDNDVRNVLTRVTGNSASEIFGRLGTFQIVNNQFTPSSANFFLVNPNGVIFGPSSSLDIGGSVVVTTANALQFPNGELFSATVPTIPSSVLTVDPSALLYNAINAQNKGIVVRSSVIDPYNLIGETSGLQTSLNKSLLLSGGEVLLENGSLTAPNGNVQIAGISQERRVDLNYEGNNINITPDPNFMRENIAILNGSIINVFGTDGISGGSISIYGKTIFLSDSSLSISRDSGNGDLGNIEVNSTEEILMNNSSISTSLPNLTEGNAGSILLKGKKISLIATNFSSSSSSFSGNGKGNAGNIEMVADESIHITRGPVSKVISDGNVYKIYDESSLNSTIGFGSAGQGGNITLKSNSISLEYASVDSSTRTGGSAGNIFLDAKLNVDITKSILNSSNWNGQYIGGSAGNNTIQAKNISLRDKTEILSGNIGKDDNVKTLGGTIYLNAVESIIIDFSRIQSEARASGTLNEDQAGIIILSAAKIVVDNSSEINTKTETNSRGGDIFLNAGNLFILNSSIIGSFVERETENAIGGTVNITANNLEVKDGGKITTSVLGSISFLPGYSGYIRTLDGSRGDSGSIQINVKDSIIISGVSRTNRTLRDYAEDSLSPIGSASGIFTTIESGSIGNAGKITIRGSNISILDGGQIASQNLGIGNSENIDLQFDNRFEIVDASLLATSNQGSGGNITVSSKTMILDGNGDIKTNAIKNGGNITLTGNSIVALNDSDILAFAKDGNGGNVKLNTRAFFGQNYRPAPFSTDPATLEGNDRVDINASGSLSSGTITRPDTSFIPNSLNQLPKDTIDTTKLLANTCIVRKDKPEGTFYITGTGGLPNRPGDLSPSQYSTNTIQNTQTATRPWRKGDPIEEPQGFYKLANGRLVMSRECQI
jgi:filamentous hemagglutinin family protein